jgi:hypothetical protein
MLIRAALNFVALIFFGWLAIHVLAFVLGVGIWSFVGYQAYKELNNPNSPSAQYYNKCSHNVHIVMQSGQAWRQAADGTWCGNDRLLRNRR